MNLGNFNGLIEKAENILIVQADNPDGDSLSSSLALEALLLDKAKKPVMYCGVEVPGYLRHIPGWDRVVHEVPQNFELTIIVDTSSISLLETLQKNGEINWIKSKPVIILDHHASEPTIDFATEIINVPASSTGEVIYKIAKQNSWNIDTENAENIATSILFDTLGLTSESVTSKTFVIMSELVDSGASLAKLENRRRSSNKKSLDLVKYKAKLLSRVETSPDKRIATIDIPWNEIEKYSHSYNPSMLVIDEMRMIEDVLIAIAFKTYPDGKVTAKIRSNFGASIAGALAESFGGGGHAYASGFKLKNSKSFEQIKLECITKATELLDSLDKK